MTPQEKLDLLLDSDGLHGQLSDMIELGCDRDHQSQQRWNLEQENAKLSAACGQMREALLRTQSALREVGNDYPGSSCFTWCHARADEADAALSTDAGKGWVDASEAVAATVSRAPDAATMHLYPELPESMLGKPVLIVLRPEGWKP